MLVKTLDNQPLRPDPSMPPSTSSPATSTPPRLRRLLHKFRRAPSKRILITIFLVLLLLIGLGYSFFARPLLKVAASVRRLEASARQVLPKIQSQDLDATSEQLQTVTSDLQQVSSDFRALSWLRVIPFARNYYYDGTHLLSAGQDLLAGSQLTLDAITPYADLLGLKALSTGNDGGKTAQDRINFIVNTIDKIAPQLDGIGAKLASAQQQLDQVDPNRYPQQLRGQPLRSQLAQGINLVDQLATLVNDARPLLQSAPYILGVDSPRKYLVLFQNDAEIRPTGGFLTGYSIIQVTNGKISNLQSDDIYKLDELFRSKIPAPEPIKKYHPLVPYWYLRDQNLSPDFQVSMDTFYPNYQTTKSPTVDGIIAVDTQLLVNLLRLTGPIGVPNLGTFSAEDDSRCDCPQVFYELQLLAGGEEAVVWDSVSGKIVQAPDNYLNRKAFLGPFMYSVIANVMAQPKSKVPELVNTIFESVLAKHVFLYFVDPEVQAAAESFNIAGRVRDFDGDYLMVVDTNFSGAKTNIWVAYKADQKVEISSNGTVTKTLTLTYSNPQAKAVKITQARNLNGLFRDWLRVYVPAGSRLIETAGFESGQATSEDLGRTVFEGFFTLAPGNTRQITLKYELPSPVRSPYKLLIQKQGGSKVFPYTLTLNGRSKPEILLDRDAQLEFAY